MEEVNLLSIYLPSYFRIQHMRAEEEQVTISAQTIKQEATCPDCKTPTQRVHSYYPRIP